jgi:hypothetical protein
VNGQCWPSILTKVLGDVVRDALSTDKDEHLGVLAADLVEMLDEFVALLKVAADFNDLFDVVVGSEFHGADVNLNKVFQEVLNMVHND